MTLNQLKRKYFAEGIRLGYKKALNEGWKHAMLQENDNSDFNKDLIHQLYLNWILEIIDYFGIDPEAYEGTEEIGLMAVAKKKKLSKQDLFAAMKKTKWGASARTGDYMNEDYWYEKYGIDLIEDEITEEHFAAAVAKLDKAIMKLGV